MIKACILCGALGHLSNECPWEQAFEKKHHLSVLIALSVVASFISILVAIWTLMLLHDVRMTPIQQGWAALWIFTSLSFGSSFATLIYRQKFWRKWLAMWKHRKINPDICVCGSVMKTGGGSCKYGGCLSVKQQAIRREIGA